MAKQVIVYKAARLHASDKYEGMGRTYKYNEITRGCVISALCEGEAVIVRDDELARGNLQFFAVYGLVNVNTDRKLWAIAKRMRRTTNGDRKLYQVCPDAGAIVELGGGVRRAGAAHSCDAGCKSVGRGMDVQHSSTALDGGVFELWTREDGYPPHRG